MSTATTSVNHRKRTSDAANRGRGTAKFVRAPGKPRLNTATWIAAANPRVTTARSTPRRRRAGRPTTTPTGTAARPPKSRAASTGTPEFSVSHPTVQPPTPARLTWQSDTIRVSAYRNPTERAMTAVMIAPVARNRRKSLRDETATPARIATSAKRASARVIPHLRPALPEQQRQDEQERDRAAVAADA